MYACKFQFQHLNSVHVHGAFCPVVFDVLVASSSPVEGRGRDIEFMICIENLS